MSSEERIFEEALQRQSASERAAYVERACGTDPDLRRRVDSLLAAHDRAGEFLESPPPGVQQVKEGWDFTDRPVPAESSGVDVGPYRLVEQIGEGATSVVYVAEQRQPVRRQVALKILKPGMDTAQVLARFEAERQALAMMEHPGIAKIYDAGTTPSGRPYFVMELVRGLPITDHCDEHKLNVRGRLELFLRVCTAVGHAHQKGVIHRDLKPSNILTVQQDGFAHPKIIDFGVAKAIGRPLADGPTLTGAVEMLGTPLYMSPEQAEMGGVDIDTRSDIYGLGVVLYELLTGTTAFERERLRGAGLEQIRRIIREEEPPRPSERVSRLVGGARRRVTENLPDDGSKLQRLLRGDLDWIVLKAMAKEPGRRYATADAFATDVRHFLDDEPVLARPPGKGYRLAKFVRKHRVAVLGAAVVILGLVLGTIGMSVGVVRALSARAEALSQKKIAEDNQRVATQTLRDARATAEFLEQVLASANPWTASGTRERPGVMSIREMLDLASEKLDSGVLKEQKGVEASVRRTLASGYRGQGLYSNTEKQLKISLRLRRELHGSRDHPDVADALIALANLHAMVGKNLSEAQELIGEAVSMRRRLYEPGHLQIADALDVQCRVVRIAGDFAKAEALARESLAIRERHPHDGRVVSGVLRTKHHLAMALGRKGDHAAAIPLLIDVLKGFREALPPGHLEVATILLDLGTMHYYAGQAAQAVGYCREALEIRLKHLPPDHSEIFNVVERLAPCLQDAGLFAEAETVVLGQYRRLKALPKIPPQRELEALRQIVALYQDWQRPRELGEWGAALHNHIKQNIVQKTKEIETVDPGARASENYAKLCVERGTLHARIANFAAAGEDLKAAVGINPSGFGVRFLDAAIRAYEGDLDTYGRNCRELLGRISADSDHVILAHTLRVCLLVPEAGGQPHRLGELAEQLIPLRAAHLRSLPSAKLFRGIAHYRFGEYEAALRCMKDVRLIERPNQAIALKVFTAMAHHRLGRAAEAEAALALVFREMDRRVPIAGVGDLAYGELLDWFLCQMARREAEALIRPPSDAPGRAP